MRISEAHLRRILREELINLPRESEDRIDEIFGALFKLFASLFKNMGRESSEAADEAETALSGEAQQAARSIQTQAGIQNPVAWSDLKPKENHTDKAVWAATVESVLGEFFSTAMTGMVDAMFMQSLGPTSEEQADEWESSKDADYMRGVYKGIGGVKGALLFLGEHLNSAKAEAESIREEEPLADVLEQTADALQWMQSELMPGIVSAIDSAKSLDLNIDASILATTVSQTTDYARDAANHVRELQEKTEELAKAKQEQPDTDPAQGMPENNRSLSITRRDIRRIILESMNDLAIMIPDPPSELERILELPTIQDKVRSDDTNPVLKNALDKRIVDLFDIVLTKSGFTGNRSTIKKLKKEIKPIIKHHKKHFNIDRPYELAEKLGLPFSYNDLESAKTRSYPSGHAAQAYYIAEKLSKMYPSVSSHLFQIADMVADSRLNAGVHFPSDIAAGKELAKKLALVF